MLLKTERSFHEMCFKKWIKQFVLCVLPFIASPTVGLLQPQAQTVAIILEGAGRTSVYISIKPNIIVMISFNTTLSKYNLQWSIKVFVLARARSSRSSNNKALFLLTFHVKRNANRFALHRPRTHDRSRTYTKRQHTTNSNRIRCSGKQSS